MKSRPKKKEIVVFYIYYRGRGRAVGDGARTRVREKGKSMGNVGRGGERRYLGVCSDGFRRRWVDREDDGGYAEKKGRKNGKKRSKKCVGSRVRGASGADGDAIGGVKKRSKKCVGGASEKKGRKNASGVVRIYML